MIISNLNLDDLDRQEFLHFLNSLISYYYVLFNEELIIGCDKK